MGTSGSLRLEVPSENLRTQQKQAVMAVGVLVLLSITAGTVVAVVTARRLADPLQDVADRAARLAEGDFRPDPRRHDIPELDRVSDVLDAATVRSEEHTSELQSLMRISYAVFCLKKKNQNNTNQRSELTMKNSTIFTLHNKS